MAETAVGPELRAHVEQWIARLESALVAGDREALTDLFHTDAHGRDLVALTWDIRQFWGREALVEGLVEHAGRTTVTGFRIDPERSAPRVLDGGAVDFFVAFETSTGRVSAFVLADRDPRSTCGLRAQLIATSLMELTQHPVTAPGRRGFAPSRRGETWRLHREGVKGLGQEHPDVLVVGGGQTGLTMGARLDRLGVSYLVVDRNASPGDGWRRRYSSLALHTPTVVNDLPYVRQPQSFPGFLSKDQWADYLDAYLRMMDLNWSGSTELVDASFDEQERAWTATLRGHDGELRTLRPRHIVTALGYTGTEPRIPDLQGLDGFAGEVRHSSAFTTGEEFTGKRVLVVGASTSGHDIALDLSENGADVYLGQRGPACVVPIDEAERYNGEYLDRTMTVEEVDQRRNSGFVYPLLLARSISETARTEREYADMFDGLRKAGLTLTVGEDRSGWLMKLHRTFSGYYLDVGASQAIIDGEIKVLQMAEVETFLPTGLRRSDGSQVELDAVILATGYQNNRVTIERIFGPDVADLVGPIGGIGSDGEHRNLARPTRQPHLWMLFGGIMDARKMSELLAWQIIAQLDGVVPTLVRGADGFVAVYGEGA